MGHSIRNVLLVTTGAALALIAIGAFRNDDPSPSAQREPFPPTVSGRTGNTSTAPEAAAPQTAADSAPIDEAPSSPAIPAAQPTPLSSASSDATTGRNPQIVAHAPSDTPVAVTALPNRRPDDASDRSDATDLLDAARISCDFGPGINTGLRFSDTLTVGAGAEWMGGLIVYDLLEPGAGIARMTGSLGATGSPNGEAKVQLMTVDTRIRFLGVLPNLTLSVTTIYDELDDLGRHIAVLSRHENGFFTYAAQFLGTCE